MYEVAIRHQRLVLQRSAITSEPELIAILDPIFGSRTLEEWATTLDREGCFWGRVQSVAEVIEDPQAEAIGAFAPIELPDGRRLRILRSPVTFTGTPATVTRSAPEVGQHTEEVLLEAGFDWQDIARLKDEGVLG
jgi:crotonobetainyl-CoA:carnitine CoA-transferase CaiB-like acyl-CoA transferase